MYQKIISGKTFKKAAAIFMLFAFLCQPTAAFASGLTKAADITGNQQSNIYYGSYWQNGSGTALSGYTKTAVKYRVLAASGTATSSTSDGQILLLSDQGLYADAFNSQQSMGNTWCTSEVRGTLNNTTAGSGFAGDSFSTAEYNAISDTTHIAGSGYSGNTTSSTDKLFLLSVEEAAMYGFTDDNKRKMTATTMAKNVKMYGNGNVVYVNGNSYSYWLLRSPGPDSSKGWHVYYYGYAKDDNPIHADNNAVRAAFNLNSDSVLFATAANGLTDGKGAVAAGAGFALPDYTGTDYKLTLKTADIATPSNISVTQQYGDGTVDGVAANTSQGGTMDLTNGVLNGYGDVKVSYTGATTGTNKYVSAIVSDTSGNLVNYAKVKSAATESSGTDVAVGVTNLADGEYKMQLFGEEANGDYLTDYASNLSTEYTIHGGADSTYVNQGTLGAAYKAKGLTAQLGNGFNLSFEAGGYNTNITTDAATGGATITAGAGGTTITGNLTVGARLNTSGAFTLSGNNEINAVVAPLDDETLTLAGGTTNISTTGRIENKLKIISGATLNNNGTISGEVTNEGTLKLTTGTINTAISSTGGTGKISIEGEVKLGAAVSNQDITVTGGSKFIVNSADYELGTSNNLTLGADSTLDMKSGDVYNTVTVNNFNADPTTGSTVLFDAKIDNGTISADKIAAAVATGKINLGSVNITLANDSATPVGTEKTLELVTNADSSFVINGTVTATSEGYMYNFTQDSTNKGTLKATKDYAGSLADIVQNNEIGGYKMGNIATYSMVGNYTTTEDLGNLTRVDAAPGTQGGSTVRNFTINGNGHTLNTSSTGKGGITLVNSGDTLNVTNITVDGFATAVTNCTGATVNLNGVTFQNTDASADANVINGGTLNLNGTASSFDKGIINNGTLNINTAAANWGTNGITGTGTTAVSSVVSMDANIAQTVELKNGADLTFAAGKGINATSATGNINGLYVNMSAAADIAQATFGAGGYINATSAGGGAYGIGAQGTGTTTVKNLGGITANASGTSGNATGIYTYGQNENFKTTVAFAGTNPTIKATSASGNAYGIKAEGIGTTTVSELGGIEAKSTGEEGGAYGIYSNGSTGFKNNVSFASGSKINATSEIGDAYGIAAKGTGTTTVTELGGIETEGYCTTYGIYSKGSDTGFENNVSFANGSSIKATIAYEDANAVYGIQAEGNGTTTVTNLGSITANATGSSMSISSYGIYSAGNAATFANNVSFKGNGGQAITATAADAANAYSIYVAGQGATTVNFENSILSGKVAQSGTSTLTLNFNNGGVWTPTAADVSGNVTVNINNGGTLDTRSRNAAGEVTTAAAKTINLGTGAFKAEAGSKISFDAVTTNDALTTDQIIVASAAGEIELGSVNVKDTATADWTEAKTATVFDTGATPTGIAINGTTTTTTSGGRKYKFTGLANGKVKAEVETTPVVIYTLPQTIQANPQEAGQADTYSMQQDITLDADLGTLNNAYRSSGKREFTLNGNGKTLAANGKGGVTINSGDTMTVKNMTVKDFAQFANNEGKLVLNGVTATGTTVDLVTGEGATEITGGATKLGDAGITQKSITIANSAGLTAKANKLLATDGIANNGSLILTDGNLASEIKGTGTTTFNGTSTVSNNIQNSLLGDGASALLTLLDTAKITGDVTADNNSNIYVWQNAASSSKYTAKNNGTIHFMGGTLTAKGSKTIGGLFGTEHGQNGGKFILEADGVLDTQASQLFSDVTTWSSLTADAQKIKYTGGSVKIADEYTLDKVSAANAALKTASSSETTSSFVVTGDLITEIGGQEYKNVTTTDSLDNQNLENTVFDKVTAVALNGSMLVGTNSLDEGKIVILKQKTGIDIKDTSATSINIDKLELKGQEATGVVISNGHSVTVGGFSGRNTQTASDVIVNEIAKVDVVVGLDKATSDAIGLSKQTGSFTIGNGAEDANTKYQLTGNVTVNEDSTLNVASKSETTITKDLNLKGAIVTVNKEGVLNVGGEVTVAKDTKNFIEGSIKGEKLVNDGTLTASASGLGFKTIQNNSMHTLNLTDGEIQAEEIISDGQGSVKIMGDVTATGQKMTNQVVTVTAGNSLTFTGKTTTFTGGQLKPEEGSTLAFNLDSFKDKDTIVSAKASGKVNLLGKDKVKVKLLQEKSPQRFTTAGQYVTLIDNVENYGYTQQSPNEVEVTSDLVDYKYTVYEEANELLAGYLGAQAMEETKSLSEGRLAGAAALTQANDLMADAGITQAVSAANLNGANGAAAFASIQGAHGRYHTGSYVDLNSFNVAAGLAKKLKNDATTIGLFIEGGNGRYASYNDLTTDGEVRADGDINYFGGGVFARHNFKQTDKGNAYLDATFGAGHTNQDYATENMSLEGARYDTGSSYLKAHASFGYEWKLAKGAKVDSYLKYLYTRQNGSDVTTNTEVPVSFDTINSHRLRAGVRYTQDIKKAVSWYGGLAYEYEFDMEASADINKIAIAKPDLKGASGMAELGIKFNPETAKNWKFDLGVQGFTGKRDSIGVKLGAWYEF